MSNDDLTTFHVDGLVWVVPAREAAARSPEELLPWLESQPGLASLEALGRAWPDLHERLPTARLASALAALHGLRVELGGSLREAVAAVSAGPEGQPDGFRARRLDDVLVSPDPDALAPPVLEGATLTSYEFARPEEVWTDRRRVKVSAWKVTYRLAGAGWTREAVALPALSGPLDAQGARAAEARFGGPLLGVLTLAVGEGRLQVALEPGPGAAAAVWIEGGAEARFPTFSALLAAHPPVAAPDTLARLARAILRELPGHDGLEPLADPRAWLETWEREHRDVRGTHYQSGKTWETVTRHTLSAPDRIAPPRLDGEVLTFVAASVARQPKQVRLRLDDLRPSAPPEVEPLTTSQVIQDTSRDLPEPPSPH
ncbi:MAG: hypothetical protein KF878_29635 [Planctomycetes bacterium]|nr:hypothetical protein [Planctomycetota bacterium]